MLSRVADNLYWMSRYIERAEGMARMIQVHQSQALEYAQDDQQIEEFWKPVLLSICADDVRPMKMKDIEKLESHSFFQQAFQILFIPALLMHGKNARMVRDQLSEELWIELNNIYLFFQNGEATTEYDHGSDYLLDRIIRFSLVFQGLADATISS